MRIISGKYKGRRIAPPKNLPVRPTTDMSKEALFNVLNNHFNFSELKVLELFAGTGSISYEFASRGCSPILCVDGDMGCVNFIKKTAKEFDFDITAIKSDVFKFLEKHHGNYDIIFADPPYGMAQKEFEKIIEMIFENELLDEEGMLVVEHSKYTKLDHMANYSFQKNYGGSVFTFFEFEGDDEESEAIEDEDES
ncbi:16S rRNA (guanine(966)-N(2))-methyltransferase RsmD [Flavobacterium sp. J49]|uniref:16S rRNA (guanine(966)-N(2))-methyltransferase RsmD n=1 Tax=Flavobacterium sp. J49 TaxID=2718534 RepID=UPI0015937EBE|nr:16S rRNA (guanine(966)-N(2))-methyltransferase RsmD [Flavobacterium sp. J49]MBF6640435.1 16S rRNA (guanine(966)-N(2))-methyltransferase RsmD [Flavobacterium sp. J49]NIC01682.1 16S rRNA (guanine(966)-N(2))-methyltransferase RsmD [Flavobacterium sp. J49]